MGTEKTRVWRTVAEKRRIVELTFQPGMSVARVAQAEGVNSHVGDLYGYRQKNTHTSYLLSVTSNPWG